MYKTDKRLTENHLTEEERANRLKKIKNLTDVDDKAEEFKIEFERAGLLDKIKAKKPALPPKEELQTED